MTEISDLKDRLPPSIERFVLHWGEMGVVWGVNRSVGQIHALLYVSSCPLAAEDIAERLSLARSNVSTSLRELIGWGLIRRVSAMGDRRDYYEAETDMLEMVRRIGAGRKAREIDPTLAMLRSCVADSRRDARVDAQTKARLTSMLDFVETVDKGVGEIMRLPNPTLSAILKLGGRIARFVGGGRKSTAKAR